MKDEEARMVIKELVDRIDKLERYIEKIGEANALKMPLKSGTGVCAEFIRPKFWKECFGR